MLAVALNEAKSKSIRKTVQMVTYAPYFISTVIMVTLLMQWTDLRTGILNQVLAVFGFQAQDFMTKPEYFRSLFVWSGVWQFTGFNSIIYLAALSGVDQELYEAATVDGASKIQKIWLIDLPSIMPTVIILLILSTGQIMNVGFDKVYLMQNTLNTPVSEVISTYTYKVGLLQLDFSYSTAIGLFNSVVNFFLITIVNLASRKIGETSLW
jgi:putative aldouronate transport system permease protein